jgi:Holliday junction DNA helicase RuvA
VIGRLRGKLIEREPSGLVVDAGGVGYSVAVPLSTFTRLNSDTVDLYVHTEVRSDAILLFGFLSREEREVFRRLISVQGVGPTTALAVLSGLSLAELVAAVQSGDHRRLKGIPRVGPRTAERICLELREKLGDLAPSGSPLAVEPSGVPADLADALVALENLGYKRAAALAALQKARAENSAGTLELWIRLALARLSP